MRAVRYDGQSVVLDADAPEPACAPGDALVRPALVQIAPPDLGVIDGSNPFTGVLGHRFVGVVESVNDPGLSDLLGRRVVGDIDMPPADSDLAGRGLAAHDPDRQVLGLCARDGCLAERFTIPAGRLAPVPDAVSDESAVFAVPLAQAIHAANLVRLDARVYVTVLGDSLLAMLCAQVMSQRNASVRLLGTNTHRLALVERWGVRNRHTDEAGRRQDQDVVIDCTPANQGLPLAMWLVRPRGTIILTSQTNAAPGVRPAGATPIDLSPAIEHELTIIGARSGHVVQAIAMMGSGRVDLSGLVTHTLRLDDAERAFAAASDPDAIAVLVTV